MNSLETPVYSKRRVLYGLNLAKKSKRPTSFSARGNLDIVTLHQAGFDNAVASMGTALIVEQTRLLQPVHQGTGTAYDNDNAGKIATERAPCRSSTALNSMSRCFQLPRRLVDGEYVSRTPTISSNFRDRTPLSGC